MESPKSETLSPGTWNDLTIGMVALCVYVFRYEVPPFIDYVGLLMVLYWLVTSVKFVELENCTAELKSLQNSKITLFFRIGARVLLCQYIMNTIGFQLSGLAIAKLIASSQSVIKKFMVQLAHKITEGGNGGVYEPPMAIINLPITVLAESSRIHSHAYYQITCYGIGSLILSIAYLFEKVPLACIIVNLSMSVVCRCFLQKRIRIDMGAYTTKLGYLMGASWVCLCSYWYRGVIKGIYTPFLPYLPLHHEDCYIRGYTHRIANWFNISLTPENEITYTEIGLLIFGFTCLSIMVSNKTWRSARPIPDVKSVIVSREWMRQNSESSDSEGICIGYDEICPRRKLTNKGTSENAVIFDNFQLSTDSDSKVMRIPI